MRFNVPASLDRGHTPACAVALTGVLGLVTALSLQSLLPVPAAALPISIIQLTGFSSWRPYSNPNRLVSIGMNKGEVFAIAGKPDFEESYYQSRPGRGIRVSDWYYIRSGHDPETTLLKFAHESLVSITTTPTRR